MKNLLIATNNVDKYQIVIALIDKIFPNEFVYFSLKNLNVDYDVVETGSIMDRAIQKAEIYWKYINNKDINRDIFAVVGIDDGIGLSEDDAGNPNSKELTEKMLSGKLIKQGEGVWIKRAFAIYNEKLGSKVCLTSIPLIFLGNQNNILRKEDEYPLSQVLAPRNENKAMSDISFEATIDYTLKYSEKKLRILFDCIKKR